MALQSMHCHCAAFFTLFKSAEILPIIFNYPFAAGIILQPHCYAVFISYASNLRRSHQKTIIRFSNILCIFAEYNILYFKQPPSKSAD